MDFSCGLMQKSRTLIKYKHFKILLLRKLTNSPPCVLNYTLHIDLKLKTINEKNKSFYKRFNNHLVTHKNFCIQNLASVVMPGNSPRRLKYK